MDSATKAAWVSAALSVFVALCATFVAYTDIQSRLARIEEKVSAGEIRLGEKVVALDERLKTESDRLDARIDRLEDRFNAKFGTDSEDGARSTTTCDYNFPDFPCPRAAWAPIRPDEHSSVLLCGVDADELERDVGPAILVTESTGKLFPDRTVVTAWANTRPSEGCSGHPGDTEIGALDTSEFPEDTDRRTLTFFVPPWAFEGGDSAFVCVTVQTADVQRSSARIRVRRHCTLSEADASATPEQVPSGHVQTP